MEPKITAVLGASVKPERYSNKVLRMLKQYGHQVISVHPAQAAIEGRATVRSLAELPHGVGTITVYVSLETSEKMVADFIAKAPRRVILKARFQRARYLKLRYIRRELTLRSHVR